MKLKILPPKKQKLLKDLASSRSCAILNDMRKVSGVLPCLLVAAGVFFGTSSAETAEEQEILLSLLADEYTQSYRQLGSYIDAGSYYVLRDTRVYRMRKPYTSDEDNVRVERGRGHTKYDFKNIKAGTKLKLSPTNFPRIAYIVQHKLEKVYIDIRDVGTRSKYEDLQRAREYFATLRQRWEAVEDKASLCPQQGRAVVMTEAVGFFDELIARQYVAIGNVEELQAAYVRQNRSCTRILHPAELVAVIARESETPALVKVVISSGETLYVSPAILMAPS